MESTATAWMRERGRLTTFPCPASFLRQKAEGRVLRHLSISVQSNIWKSAPYSGEKLLVLLALADFSNDEGKNCFPTMGTLAQKARITVRSAYRIIAQLKKDEAIKVKSGGGKKHNSYEISSNYSSTDKKSPLTKSHPDIGDKPPITPNKEEPSLEPFSLTPSEPGELSLHYQVRKYIEKVYQGRFNSPPSWDKSEAKILKDAIAANPTWIFLTFQRLIDNRYASEKVNGERPRIWLGDLGKYMEGPLDKWGNVTGKSPVIERHEITISERMRQLAAGAGR